MSVHPSPAQPGTPEVRLRQVPVAEVRQLLAGGAPQLAGGAQRGAGLALHPDYPMSETFDLAAMLWAAYEANGPVPDRPRWWIHQIVVGGTVVGDVGFHGPAGAEPPSRVEIGYAVVPAWRGRGVATQACRLILALAWTAGADRVVAETSPTNPASRRVLLAAGFRAGPDGVCVVRRRRADP